MSTIFLKRRINPQANYHHRHDFPYNRQDRCTCMVRATWRPDGSLWEESYSACAIEGCTVDAKACGGYCPNHFAMVMPTRGDARGDWCRPPVAKVWRQPRSIYVASSWRNEIQPTVVSMLAEMPGVMDVYDFKNPPGGTGFSWKQVQEKPNAEFAADPAPPKGSDWEPVETYLEMVTHPIALKGFRSDFDAMLQADTFVMVLPCGKSAHLELGWATGAGKQTVVLLEDPVEPELMYHCADSMVTSLEELHAWMRGPA